MGDDLCKIGRQDGARWGGEALHKVVRASDLKIGRRQVQSVLLRALERYFYNLHV